VADGEDDWLISRILDDIFLLRNSDKKARAYTGRYLLFDMVRRQNALKVTNGVIAERINVVTEDQCIGLGLNEARFIYDD
jgi:hypothetical protein